MNKNKVLICLILCTIFLTGCSIKRINTDNYENNINIILSRKSKYTNTNAVGYQYYLPSGIVKKEVNDFNQKLVSKNGNYYMYVDVVSYYHKIENNYTENKSAYISKKIENKDKSGYIEVNKEGKNYFLEIMYNYGKIESYVNEKKLNDAISDSIYILSSIKFNDDVINSLLSDDKYTLSDDETYNIFKTKQSSQNNFLKYVEEYDNYDTNNAKSLIEHESVKKEE